ncbi:MAG: polysaccharide lyase family 8 super-sandwich domain-containing protein [Lachnospiraceae bacterium]|nr:polysaccharide lyase family 8 super-sandwich domain-containing protein [Lachnospiraceae bacterium]
MGLKQNMRQGISAMLIAAMSLGNMMSAAAAPLDAGVPEGIQVTSEPVFTISTPEYEAALNPSGGGLMLSKNSDTSQWWNQTEAGMIPGETMLLQSDGTARSGGGTTPVLAVNGGNFGVNGVKLGGELTGMKSWFFFGDEIVCAGAGIANTGGSPDTVIHVVDKVPVKAKATKAALPNPWNGYRIISNAVSAADPVKSWSSVLDTPTKGNSPRDWMTASDLSDVTVDGVKRSPLQWGYVFGDTITNSQVYYRFPTEGSGTAKQFELWTRSVNGGYSYTLEAGGYQTDYPNNASKETSSRLLSNTKTMQAAENPSEGILAVNKWTKSVETVSGQVAQLSLNQPASIVLKRDSAAGTAEFLIAKPKQNALRYIELTADLPAESVSETGGTKALVSSNMSEGLFLKLETAKMGEEPVRIQVTCKLPETISGDHLTLVRGQVAQLEKPAEFTGNVTWSTKFLKADGTFLRNSGSSEKKRELEDGEKDGGREAGDTSASHLLMVQAQPNGNGLLTAKEKGQAVVVAQDSGTGQTAVWHAEVLYEDPDALPQAAPEDYEAIRQSWRESVVGTSLSGLEGGSEILAAIDAEAAAVWERYAYKGQDACLGVPWPEDIDAKGNPNVPYEKDAVEFRPAFNKVLTMAKAYGSEGSAYYQDAGMLTDITHILDYLCSTCYTAKSQTDNWWTWEIGMPKDLLPALMLLYDGLTKEQVTAYTDGLLFFQPDPYHEGVIHTASTHAEGYRKAQGANIIDCSVTAIGLGALREDNELVYLGTQASSGTFIIQQVADSSKLAANGYLSGFYPDGSYLDHKRVPYTGSYGIEFMKGAAKIPNLVYGTPWQYSEEVSRNMEHYILEGYGSSMYRGRMLDCLKGRSLARPGGSNLAAGREAMITVLQLSPALSAEAQEQINGMLKAWMESDPGFLDSLTGAEYAAVKIRAQEILDDPSIEGNILPMHRSFPFMDRAVHRTDRYLFALSMYSERIQNTEIMNHENRFGWHQNDGMTYLYDSDLDQYSDNFWNTVNPLRLPGTTVVPVNIGTGKPDSSGYAQDGDYCSYESWVGGTSIGDYGISGMALSGKNTAKNVTYAPLLKGRKSWFMFEDEIVCLGAGIENGGMDLPVETTIENRRLGEEGENRLLIDGEEAQLPLKEARVTELVERTADVSGTSFDQVSWAHLDGTESAGTGYYFPEAGTTILARRGRNTGDWSDIGTFQGESTQNYLEMWFDHGVNPADASYSYVLLPEKTAEETEQYAQEPEIAVLMNTSSAQAVYHKRLGITGINFWEDQGGTVGDISCSQPASVMLEEDADGVLTVSVSDPTLKNKGKVCLEIQRAISEEISADPNVTCEITEKGAVLTFAMANTNGEPSSASLQLSKSILPNAASIAKGGSQAFTAVDYSGEDMSDAVWSVKGFGKGLAYGTGIDENGLLLVDEDETNDCLLVTAETSDGVTLQAYVSLGGQAVKPLPSDMEAVKEKIQAAIQASETYDMDDYRVQNAVKKAVNAIAAADNGALSVYLMDLVLDMNQLYEEASGAVERPLTSSVEVAESAEELNPVTASGLTLNIPVTKQASPSDATASNAVLEIKKASASVATRSRAARKTEESGNVCRYQFSLFLEDADGTRTPLKQRTPISVTFTAPEELDGTLPVRGTVTGDGKTESVTVQYNRSDGTITVLMTRMGVLTLTNQRPEIPDEPDKPESPDKPEIPDKPDTPDTPDVPGEEKPVFQVYLDEDIIGGRLSADRTEGEAGTRITVTAWPDRGYRFDYMLVNGKRVRMESERKYSFLLTMDTEITAYFRRRFTGSDAEENEENGWVLQNGRWKYRLPNGDFRSGQWDFIQGSWYCFDQDGYRKTGWHQDSMDGCWYYLKPDGTMATGWLCIDGKWYYFNPTPAESSGWYLEQGVWKFRTVENPGMPQGAMYHSGQTPDGYLVDQNGAWISETGR